MSFKNTMYKVGDSLKKNSPDILVVVGIGGFVATTVVASIASTKLSLIVDDMNDTLVTIENALEEHPEKYSDEDAVKDRYAVKVKGAVSIAKLYAPALFLGVASAGCIWKSHAILKNRMLSLSAAYTTLAVGFAAYQERVSARFGEEVEQEIRHNVITETYEETIVNGKGKAKTTTKERKTISGIDDSPYSSFFIQGNPNFEKNRETNMMFLTSRQQYANDLLKANRKLYLNEVNKMLGLPITDEGQLFGWIYDPENPAHIGDNYVDFGISEHTLAQDFNIEPDPREPNEPVIRLEFNVDPEMLLSAHKLKKLTK